ncbi:MAG TPA: heme ABC transporter ATP-binding protein [Candidatus Atribacteria bacterium]|nr:heme ABC transporter ATP-binding protein [Candidatus Atribacteria bacterium]HCU22811.1 heme ABC transporter ATP-binding protein [Candidatus Atribacteria bacterium]
MTEALALYGFTKYFPGVLANDHIDLTINQGEIHGLLGENGAGKSVLMSTLYGLYRPDAGKILIRGQEVSIENPAQAISYGIGMVHQHFSLIENMTVWENIVLGKEICRGFVLDKDRIQKELSQLLQNAGFDIDLNAKIHNLPIGLQQRVEILKILYRGADILIFDEPTAVLTPQEVDQLFKTFRQLIQKGKTIIFISHKLKEIFCICDRVTVLRHGKKIGTLPITEATPESLAEMMVGRKVLFSFEKPQPPHSDIILSVKGLTVSGARKQHPLKNVNFDLHSYEILGVAGVEGNGQTELVEALVGLRKPGKGKIVFQDQDITNFPPKKRILMGISHIPEDRPKRGIISEFSVKDNLILGFEDLPPFKRGLISRNEVAINQFSQTKIQEFEIATPDENTLIKNLSGGNQQKVVLARELSRDVKLAIASQPTRGLDIAASEYVRNKLIDLKNNGSGVLLISADLDEIRSISDRVIVLYEGQIIGELAPDADEYQYGLLMGGTAC